MYTDVYIIYELLYTLYGYDCECVGQGDSNYSNEGASLPERPWQSIEFGKS